MKTDKQMHNIILVHVARTWERIRLRQPYEEMPQDNIESACESIPEIAYDIYKSDIIQKLIDYKKDDWCWRTMTKGYAEMSDTYIEKKAEEIIYNKYHIPLKKDNGIIAEFMGMTYHHNDNSVMIQMTSQGNEIVPIGSMGYHNSWDWLMPVVETCYDNGADSNEIGDITHALLDFDIDTTYKAVVEFINHINKEKL